MKDFEFDLQLFAEEAGAPAAGAAEGTPAEGAAEGAPAAGAAAETDAEGVQEHETILGTQAENVAPAKQETVNYNFEKFVPAGMAYDADKAQEFSALAKEIGLNQQQAEKLAAYGMNYMQGGLSAYNEAHKQQIRDWGEQAKNELGVDYEKVVTKAAAGIEALEAQVPGLRQALTETGAGNRIEIIRMAAALGDLVSEDTFKGFGSLAMGHGQDNIYGNTDFSKY